MAVQPTIVGRGSIDEAAGGNVALRNILNQLATATATLSTKVNTSGKGSPVQSAASVSYVAPYYIVVFTDPGGAGAASLTQAAQQAAAATLGANAAQSVIYHQVQAATSILFDAASSAQTFGGDTGSLQTQFVLSGLSPLKQWFFRVRTSFDGQTWCQWKILNNKQAIEANPHSVKTSSILGGTFAAITLPGAQTVGFGVGQIASGQAIEPAQGTLIQNTLGIGAPATFNDTGHRVDGVFQNSIDANGVMTLQYEDGSGYHWDGNLNFLSFGWAVGSQAITVQTTAGGGKWVVLSLSGGGQVAIGQGRSAVGAALTLPAGFTAANMMGVATPASTNLSGNAAHGILQSNIVYAGGSATPTVLYGDGSGHSWTGEANWFAIAWQPSLTPNLVAVTGGQYILLPTPSGNVAIGVGQTASGLTMPLPVGYIYEKALAFGTLGSYNDIGNYMHGVKVCAIDAGLLSSVGTVFGIYSDGTEAVWTGNVNWFSIAWL